jgi:hypothetical protein
MSVLIVALTSAVPVASYNTKKVSSAAPLAPRTQVASPVNAIATVPLIFDINGSPPINIVDAFAVAGNVIFRYA